MAKCFRVTILSEKLVAPAAAMPPLDTELSLSWMDVSWPSDFMGSMVLVFQHHDINEGGGGEGRRITRVIRDALASALVPYYPLAGVLRRAAPTTSFDARELLKVACTGEGVWFVEASASVTLEEVGFLDLARFPQLYHSIDDVLPPPLGRPVGLRHDPTTAILMIQVTEFKCGGFVIGVRFNHAIFDGVGISTFMKAVADIARRPEASVASAQPVWCRDVIPPPPNIVYPPLSLMKIAIDSEMRYEILDIPSYHIEELKREFAADNEGDHTGGGGRRAVYCSTFDVVAAKYWKWRSRATKQSIAVGGVVVNLRIAMNMRRHLAGRFPSFPSDGAYYGNCITAGIATMPLSDITQASIPEVVKMIREAKEKAAGDYLSWILEGRRPAAQDEQLSGEATFDIADWLTIGLEEVDYGRGGPVAFFSGLHRHSFVKVSCLLVKSPPPKKGVRLMMMDSQLEEGHLASFMEEMIVGSGV